MKKIIAIMLATAFAATAIAGCTPKAPVTNNDDTVTNSDNAIVVDTTSLESVYAKIAEKTGIEYNTSNVITDIAGYELTLDEYEYMYFSYLNNALQYTMYYGFDILKDETFLANIEETFKQEIKTAPIILSMAAEKNIVLTEEEFNEKVLGSYDSMKEQYGEEFEATFESKGTPTINAVLYYNYIFALYDKILASYAGDPAEVEADLAENYVRAKHVLIQFPVNEDGSDVTEEQKAECLAEAETVLEKALAGEDFDALITEYNDDPGMTTNTDGYYFTYNEMVPEFETATFALEDNGISEIVETSYGYHIIKKLPVDDAFKATETYKSIYDNIVGSAASEAFYNDMTAKAETLARTDAENFNELVAPVLAEAQEVYEDYEVQYNAMYSTSEETETETEVTDETAKTTEEVAE